MMIMADGGSRLWPSGEIRGLDDLDCGNVGGGENLSIDVDDFFHILSESHDPSQVVFDAAI